MQRQLLILFFIFFWSFTESLLAATPTEQTLEIPSDEASAEEPQLPQTNTQAIQDQGLVVSEKPTPLFTNSFHLKPSPSFTVTGHKAYNIEHQKMESWFGAHLAPWMTATERIQFGLDLRGRFVWTQAAYHRLLSRTRKRFYWGGGMSALADSKEDLRSFLEFENYFAFIAGGWEIQLRPAYNLRLETSYHQSTNSGSLRATLGMTRTF